MFKTLNDALSKRREALEDGENEKGFTLIELMVVIIIIGILAAIAIPAFLNQRVSAWDASVKSDLSSLAIAAASYSTANNGVYTGMTIGKLQTSYGLVITSGNLVTVLSVPTGGTSFSDEEYNTNAGRTHVYTINTGTVSGPSTDSSSTFYASGASALN